MNQSNACPLFVFIAASFWLPVLNLARRSVLGRRLRTGTGDPKGIKASSKSRGPRGRHANFCSSDEPATFTVPKRLASLMAFAAHSPVLT